MAITLSEARGLAAEYGAMYRSRDRIILECHQAGMPLTDIARQMGIARNVANRVAQQARRAAARQLAEAGRQLEASNPAPWHGPLPELPPRWSGEVTGPLVARAGLDIPFLPPPDLDVE